MLHQSSKKSNCYQEQKAARLEQAIATLEIESDPWGIFSVVPSTTKKLEVYVVNIENGKAVKCRCKGYEYGHYCIHMQATDFYLEAMVEDAESVTLTEAMEEAQAEMEQHIETAATQAERENMQKFADFKLANASDAYEQLAPTKKVEYAYGSCGHLVKPGHEGDICGGCFQKMYM
jgi:hypothetical protein